MSESGTRGMGKRRGGGGELLHRYLLVRLSKVKGKNMTNTCHYGNSLESQPVILYIMFTPLEFP